MMTGNDDIKTCYRYPGVRPFTVNDEDIFFGREDDTSRLFKLLMLEKSVVLFGKSGHGKSSLINAGLIPRLRNGAIADRFHYSAIEVRIGKVAGHDETLVKKVTSKLDEQFADLPEWGFLEKFHGLPELWYHFKKKQSGKSRKFMLIFDQFEEFFNYSDKEQEIFRWQLAELLFTEIPAAVYEKLDDLTPEEYSLLSARVDVKILFSIRSDRLSHLHSMKDALPDILHNRFEIRGLAPDQARKAITLPALKEDKKFVTHPFSYDETSIGIILKELTMIEDDGSERIEAFHIQIICQACESKIEDKLRNGEIDREINEEDLPEFENLYEEYYKRQLDKLPADLRGSAQHLLENELIFEDTETGDCRRLSVDGNILRRKFGNADLQDKLLDGLESVFLIRREINTVGGYSYEISHDILSDPIVKARKTREALAKLKEIKTDAFKEVGQKFTTAAFKTVIVLFLLVLAWKWKTVYFGAGIIANKSERPLLRLENKLNLIISNLEKDVADQAAKINYEKTLGSWEAAQIMIALENKTADSVRTNFYRLTAAAVYPTCCCWRETKDQNDLRASGWIASTIAYLNMSGMYSCKFIDFLLDNQLNDGSWSMLAIDRNLTDFGSTFATCHVLRSLKNTVGHTSDSIMCRKLAAAISRGTDWLKDNRVDSVTSLWKDYPKDKIFTSFLTASLSGLAIHTLNATGKSNPELNKHWLDELSTALAPLVHINQKEQSDKLYKFNAAEVVYRDATRHLIVPWQIIGIVDTYKDGSLPEKINACTWLDIVIEHLNWDEIRSNPAYIKAEILIALRYLQDKNYVFI